MRAATFLSERHLRYAALYQADLARCRSLEDVHATVRTYAGCVSGEAHWHYGREAAVRVLREQTREREMAGAA